MAKTSDTADQLRKQVGKDAVAIFNKVETMLDRKEDHAKIVRAVAKLLARHTHKQNQCYSVVVRADKPPKPPVGH